MPSVKDQFCDLPQPPKRAKYVGRHGKKESEKKAFWGQNWCQAIEKSQNITTISEKIN